MHAAGFPHLAVAVAVSARTAGTLMKGKRQVNVNSRASKRPGPIRKFSRCGEGRGIAVTISPHVVIFVLLMLGVVLLTRVDDKRDKTRHPKAAPVAAESSLEPQAEVQ